MKSRISSEKATPSLWQFDLDLWKGLNGAFYVGVDEAGRGPLAGNVVAACVVFELQGKPLAGLNDSKKLSESARENLYPLVMEQALAFGIGECSPLEIDRINILQATFLAMARALSAMRGQKSQAGLPAKALPPDSVSLSLGVDGNKVIPGLQFPQQALIKGDGRSASIAAASILAKVTRDQQLMTLDALYPQYGFAQHKGYPTEAHREAVVRHGLSPVHRKSFCEKLLSQVDLFA